MARDLFDETRITVDVVDELLNREPEPLVGTAHPRCAGVYLLFMDDPPLAPVYDRVAGCAWPIYAGSSESVGARMGRHRRTIATIENLGSVSFFAVTCELPSVGSALYAEHLAIAVLKPCWNSVLPGFSSSRQGRTRVSQRRSRHAVLHPNAHAGRGATTASAVELALQVRQHLEVTVPPASPWSRT